MCLHYASEELTAEEDIVVYKYLMVTGAGRLLPPFATRRGFALSNFEYKVDEVKTGRMDKPMDHPDEPDNYKIEQGLHSFAAPLPDDLHHAFRTNYYVELFKAIIPKGAKYHTGKWDDNKTKCLVSDTLIIKERI